MPSHARADVPIYVVITMTPRYLSAWIPFGVPMRVRCGLRATGAPAGARSLLPAPFPSRARVPVPVEPCANHDNDVFAAVSTDHGATWGTTRKVSDGGRTAQWQAWGDVGENGKLYVAYYDRKYGACERSGCNDITLATSTNGRTWSHRRITASSMPNLTDANNPFESGFLGDYMSTLWRGGTLHLVWGDTRGRRLGGVPEEDIYYARVPAH